jgi:ubiquinone/menaquinone biosynthesis C-methylase UbiE
MRRRSRPLTVSKGPDRDVQRFDECAPQYDQDRLQQWFFGPVHARTLQLAAGLGLVPQRVLDVGCGSGALLRSASAQWPGAALAGVDPATGMIRAARQAGVPGGLVQAAAGGLTDASSPAPPEYTANRSRSAAICQKAPGL